MEIYLLFTTDSEKSRKSRVLRGVFSENKKDELEKCKIQLVKNKVINSLEEIQMVTILDGDCELHGAYL